MIKCCCLQILSHFVTNTNISQMNTNQNQPKPLPSVYLYNMLQDFRHLLIFDFRNDYEQCHIRDSFHVHPGLNRENIMEVIQLADRKARQKQQKYQKLQKVRRYYFVDEHKLDSNHEGVQFVMKCLKQKEDKVDKYYCLSDNFQKFKNTYPFMLIDTNKLKEAAQKGQTQYDKALLYPYAKFPSQIIPDKLYLSGVASSNSQIQLKDLDIKILVDFVDYNQGQKVADFKSTHPHYQHLPFSNDVPVTLDFDVINKKIDQWVTQGKVLLYCRDGETISPAFAISYLMYKAKLDIGMATLKVCQAISRVQINKNIYTQLLVYKPKK